jgi:DNA gyrase/topoisomerase IV subunit B
MGKKQEYTSDNLKTLHFPENVRTRPTMYISFLEMPGINHLLREAVDNSVDEYLAGFGDEIIVTISNEENFICIEDNGRGIPIDNEKKFYSVFNELHSGKKLLPVSL